MSNEYEDVKDQKLSDSGLSKEEFYDLIFERLGLHAEDDETLKKALDSDPELEFQDKIVDIVNAVYDSPVYFDKALIKLAFKRILGDVRRAWKKVEYEQSLVVVDSFVGCFAGGSDWTGLTDRNGMPTKQDLIFVLQNDEGNVEIRTADTFGTKPIRDYEGELKVGEWYEVGLVWKTARNGKEYLNIGTFGEVSSEGLPALKDMLSSSTIGIFGVEKEDVANYEYAVIRGQIKNITPVPIFDDDMTKPTIHLKSRDGKALFDDDGNKVMGHPQARVGFEPLYQSNLMGDGMNYTMYVRLQDEEGRAELEDDEEDVWFEVRFYNQYLGRSTINLDLGDFIDPSQESDDDPEELATLISDYLVGEEVIGLVKLTRWEINNNNDKITQIRSNGIFLDTI